MLQLKDTINPYERVIFFIENFQLISPIDSVVHRLEYEEKKEYGTRAKKIALIYYVLYCILKKASIVYISTPIAVACSMVGISLIGGYIKYRKVAMSTE